jgi:PAS domain S-box-containing protein
MFAGSLFPWLINFLSHSTSFNPYEIDYNVYALAITSPFFAYAMFRSRMLDLVPVAHDRVFDSISDSVFVVDSNGRIADINHAACMMKGISLSVIGRNIQDGLPHWPRLVGIIERDEYGDHEVYDGPSGEEKWFMTNLSPFLDRNGQSIGQILILRDISDKKRLEIQIFENEKRLKTDIMKVRNLQAGFLPDFSKITGYDIGRIFIPVDELSGDFFDGFHIDRDIYQIILCDVIDHGILPAFIGMEIRSMFRAMSEPGIKPSELIARVNAKLLDDLASIYLFATVAVCQINLKSGQITIASGGHPPAFVYSAEHRTIRILNNTGSLIGLRLSKLYTDIVIDLKMHDILLLYTDGIYEAINEKTKDFFGTERMQSDLMANAGCSSMEILNSIVANVYSFIDYCRISDDMTMICIKKN